MSSFHSILTCEGRGRQGILTSWGGPFRSLDPLAPPDPLAFLGVCFSLSSLFGELSGKGLRSISSVWAADERRLTGMVAGDGEGWGG